MGKQCVKFLIVLAASLLSAGVFADGQQIYKWTDNQGVVHYSDKAPVKAAQPVTTMQLAELPAVDAQTEAQNQAWIASINQWYQNIVVQENQQQYNQILAWQESQDQAAVSSSDSTQEVSYVSQIYGGYRPFDYKHWQHEKRPTQLPAKSPVFKSSIWNTQPNPSSGQLYNTNPNIHF
ncbi:MAG: DUF4124 domain-containing protein [Gammaproteobacteria bacterium]